jgi:predicted RNase H-like HicB family nuclease
VDPAHLFALAAAARRLTNELPRMNEKSPPPPESAAAPTQPVLRKLEGVPVYNCHVYLSAAASGAVTARGATLSEVASTGGTEREALQNVVRAFKAAITHYASAGLPIPWVDPPLPMAAGEKPRWVPVHF